MSTARPSGIPSLFPSASWGGISSGFRAVFGLANVFLAVRMLGAESYGHYSVLISLALFYVSMFSGIATVAMTTLVRAMASVEHGAERDVVDGVWFLAFVALVTLLPVWWAASNEAIGASDFLRLGADDVAGRAGVEAAVPLLIGLTFCQVATVYNVALIEGRGRFDLAAKGQLLGPVVLTSLSVLMLVGPGLGSVADYARLALAAAATELAAVWLIRARCYPGGGPRFALPKLAVLRSIITGGGVLQAASLLGLIFDPVNRYLVNRFAGPIAATVYDIALKFSSGVQGLFLGSSRAFFQVAQGHFTEIGRKYLSFVSVGIPLAMLIYAIASCVLVIFAHFSFRGQTSDVLLFFCVLVPSGLLIIGTAPLRYVLIGVGDFGFIFRINLNLAVTNIVGSLTLIPLIGVYGAGAGMLLASATNAWAEFVRFPRKIGPIAGLADEVLRTIPRLATAAFLFGASITAGLSLGSTLWLITAEGIVLGVCALMLWREPALRLLVSAGRPGRDVT